MFFEGQLLIHVWKPKSFTFVDLSLSRYVWPNA